jgi:hypothetical protein
VKNNLTPEDGGGMSFQLVLEHVGDALRAEWLEKDVAMTADEALAGGPRRCGPAGERCEEAITYLKYALAAGPRLVKEIEAEAWQMCGIRKRTLERARSKLEVETTRESARGRWWLQLPDKKKDACENVGGLGGVGGVTENPEETEGIQSAISPPSGGVGESSLE